MGRLLARASLSLWCALALVGAAGCALGKDITPRSGPDAGRRDAGGPVVRLDAGSSGEDSGAPRDAGTRDAGPRDAGRADAGCGAVEACNGVDDDCDGIVDDGAACPCDVEQYGGHAYLVCEAPRSWLGARAFCEAYGYTLAVVEASGEDAFLYGEMAARALPDTWVGLNDALDEGIWVWLDGVPITYAHWDAGEPNDGAGGEDCGVIMSMPGRESEWDDRPCDDERPYLCETP